MDEDIQIDELKKFLERKISSTDSTAPENTEFFQWLKAYEYMPQNEDKDVLLTFLNWAGEDVENFVINFYRVRQHYYQIFRNRTPNSKPFSKYSSVMVAPFTTFLTSQWVIFGTWLLNDDHTKFDFYHQIRLIFAELDLLLQKNCLFGKRIVILMDLSLMTEKHLRSITQFAAKCVSKLFTTALPAKFASILLLNSPTEWLSEFTHLFPLLDFHILVSIEDAAGFIPVELLPSDMGGPPEALSRQEYYNSFINRLWKYSSWFANEELKRENELYVYNTKADRVQLNNERGKKKRGVKAKASD